MAFLHIIPQNGVADKIHLPQGYGGFPATCSLKYMVSCLTEDPGDKIEVIWALASLNRVKCHCSGLLPTPLIFLGGKTVKLPFFHPSALVAIIHRGSKHTLPPTWTLLNFLHHSETHPWPAQWGRIVKYGSKKMGK